MASSSLRVTFHECLITIIFSVRIFNKCVKHEDTFHRLSIYSTGILDYLENSLQGIMRLAEIILEGNGNNPLRQGDDIRINHRIIH